jgi:hypothetical protein
MLEISLNDVRLNKKEFDIISSINEILLSNFKKIPLDKSEIKIYFLYEEEYYSYLGIEKPYHNIIVTEGFYDKQYQSIHIRLNGKNIVRTYVHELGHYFDYNLKTKDESLKIGSAFTRKLFNDISYEDKVLKDLTQMPAYGVMNLAASNSYVYAGDEVFARLFEVFIWEKLNRKHFTPDLYMKIPKLFIFLDSWLAKNISKKESIFYKKTQQLHLYLLNRIFEKRKPHDPYQKDIFSKYVVDTLLG